MNTICKGVKKASTVGATAALLVAMAPSVALAEEGASGADILLPKPAEFVPALIAFLIIFAVVAKFVWPSVLRMLDKRQEKIREGEEERARIIEQAKAEAVEIITKGKGVVESERRHAMAELSDSVVDLAVDIAGKIIGNELSVEQQRALAEKYLAEVGTPDEH